MLNKEKLSEIVKEAIGTRSYFCKVEKTSSRNSYAVSLYNGQSDDDEWVLNIYVSEGNIPGSFKVDFIPLRSNKTDREVLQMINSQLFDYFNKRLEPKYYIKLINTGYGYLTLDEDTDSWHVTSLMVAKANHQKVAFTANEISKMSDSKEFSNVDLWSAAEEVDEDEQ